jgi:hypothetical protein
MFQDDPAKQKLDAQDIRTPRKKRKQGQDL